MSVAFHDFSLSPAPATPQNRQIKRERPWGPRRMTLPADYLLLRDGPGGVGIACESCESSTPLIVELGGGEAPPLLVARTLDWTFRVTCPRDEEGGTVEVTFAGKLWFEPANRDSIAQLCSSLDGSLDPGRFRDTIGRAIFRVLDVPIAGAAGSLEPKHLASRVHWQREVARRLDGQEVDRETLALAGFHLLGRDRRMRIHCDAAVLREAEKEEEEAPPSGESTDVPSTAPCDSPVSTDAAEAPETGGQETAGKELTVHWWQINHAGEWNPLRDGGEINTGSFMAVDVELHRRDAWVQIFLLDSLGRLQRLVPDDGGILGILPRHFQRAGVRRRWPGQVSLCPGLPYWKLDIQPGVERLWVVATDSPMDMDGLGAGRARGLEKPSRADVSLSHFFASLTERKDSLVSPWTFHHR